MKRGPVLVVAAGAGVGHLTRASALGRRLKEKGLAVRVAANSPFAEGLARLSGLDIVFIHSARWARELPEYLARVKPRLIILDSFPWGLRGEWKNMAPPTDARCVYLARRLRVKEYLAAIKVPRDRPCPHLYKVIVIEPLRDDHEKWIAGWSAEVHRLSGRIRLPEFAEAPPVPPELETKLDAGRLWLIVHSGPESEIRALIKRARAEMKATGAGEMALVSPTPTAVPGAPWFEYYPARRLFPKAQRLVTAAGYNAIAETFEYADKHTSVPFPRQYDDQAGRLNSPQMSSKDGGQEAADLIASWI